MREIKFRRKRLDNISIRESPDCSKGNQQKPSAKRYRQVGQTIHEEDKGEYTMKYHMLKALAIISLFAIFGCTKRTERPEHLKVGEPLPGFFTHTLDGRNVSTTGLLGKPSVIIFFSTTCPDCHRQLPEVEYAYRNYKAHANFLAIAREEDETTVKTFWNQAGYTMPVAAPGNRTIYNLFDRDSGSGVPQVYVSDKDGVVTDFTNDKKILFADDLYGILQSLLTEE